MKFRHLLSALVAFCALLLAGCGGDGGISGTGATGTLRLALTDAPSCGYDEVNITVERVRVHQSASAGDNDAGWSEIVLAPPKRVDLLALTNGVLEELGQTQLPAGKYTQLQLVLAANGGTNPPANSVVPSGGTEVPLTTPSGQQSGIKANIDIDVAADQLADFVIDFDACKSVVKAAASGKYLLKPVITVIPHFVSGIAGFVHPSLIGPDTSISLQQAGVAVKSTVPDATNGAFLLQPVAPGTYDLVVTAPGRVTAVVTGVVVETDKVTALNSALASINPPASVGGGTLSGTVDTGATSIEASVRVQQILAGDRRITVADAPVDADSGDYGYVLATDAPVVAPYVAPQTALQFVADGPAAGRYALRASAGAAFEDAGPFTLAAGATIDTDFTFP